MSIHTVFITHNRLELTKQAIGSYLDTVTPPYSYLVVDNASNDGTKEWLNSFDHPYFALTRNRYPGYACNLGWEKTDAELLHRADNDFIFLDGWREEVERMFAANPRLGQLGLRTDEEELHNGHNVGGNCVIRRDLWDEGLRWDERPWTEIKTVGYTEDSFMSPAVARMGWEWDRVERPCIQSVSFEDPDDPYYQRTWADRGIVR